jgi:FixJ family two-component response regulator
MTSASLPPALVCVVDDDEGFRESLTWMVRAAGYRVSAYASAERFLEAHKRGGAACIVLDIRMPQSSGLELQQELSRRDDRTPIIFVTAHGDVELAVRAMKHGAFDFIEKPFKGKVLLALIQNAVQTGARRRTEAAQRRATAERLAALSGREHEVLAGIVKGKTNRAIAADLGITSKTVEYHRARLMEKLGVTSVAELVRLVFDTPEAFTEKNSGA